VNFVDPLGWARRANEPPNSGGNTSHKSSPNPCDTSDGGLCVVTLKGPGVYGNAAAALGSGRGGGGLGGGGVGGGGGAKPPAKPEPNPCDSKLNKLGNGIKYGGEVITKSGFGLALLGELIEPAGGGTGGAIIATVGGVMSAAGQAAQDIAFDRPGLETGLRFLANASGGKLLTGGLRAVTKVGGNATVDAATEYGAGKALNMLNDVLDPKRCPVK
jgi:hypothetical protein